MELLFTWVGKTKNVHLAALEREYLERLRRFLPCRCHVVRPLVVHAEGEQKKRRDIEGQKILASLPTDAYVVVLDETAEMLSSKELADFIGRQQAAGVRWMSFIVGSHDGLSLAVRERADKRLSLSRMTLPHELVRVILLEQVYRAFAIIHRLPYSK